MLIDYRSDMVTRPTTAMLEAMMTAPVGDDRLSQDHQHARMFAFALEQKDFVGEILPVETNIIIFEVKYPFTPKSFVDQLKEHNILSSVMSPTQVRLVIHLDITPEMVERTIKAINSIENVKASNIVKI